jgi:hypothetical protein
MKAEMKSIAILIDYFGAWPKWFPVFLSSCKFNSTVNWIIRTDCDIPADAPPNVKFIRMDYKDYIGNVSRSLGINFSPSGNYKICDIKPMYADMYCDDIKDFDYFGFGDLDVIYGDIRKFYTEDVLSHDVISTHADMLSGHLALFRNTESLRKAYLRIPRWKEYIENPESTRFDEDIFSCLFLPRDNFAAVGFRSNLLQGLRECDELPGLKVYFKEQYTTVFIPMDWHDGIAEHPDVWFWKNGIVTNNRNAGHDYLYLHMMNFQSMRWASSPCREQRTPWKNNPDVRFTLTGEETDGVRIDWTGIQALSTP